MPSKTSRRRRSKRKKKKDCSKMAGKDCLKVRLVSRKRREEGAGVAGEAIAVVA